jgi:hypothetical protein
MSDRYDKNLTYLQQANPSAVESFRAVEKPDPSDRETFTIKLPSGNRSDVPIQPRDYRLRTRERVNQLSEDHTVVVGVDRPRELEKIARRTGDADCLYLEMDPRQFEAVLEKCDLSEPPFGSRFTVEFAEVGYTVPLLIAEWVNEEGRAESLPQVVAGSRTLLTLLRGNRPIDRWFQALFFESPANLTDEMFEEMKETLEVDDGVPNAYFYRRFRDILETMVVAGPGIDRVEEEREPIPEGEPLPPVSIVILSWNRWDLTQGCLEGVLEEFPPPEGSEVIVVDNGSTDESPEKLREMEQSHDMLKAVLLDENRGPAGGREAATEHLNHELAVFLDNDSRVRDEDWLKYLIEPFQAHERAGAVGAYGVIHTSDEDPSRLNQKIVYPDVDVPVTWCSGYCLAMRVEALKDAGGWKPDLYHKWGSEDVAIHYALRENGWFSLAPGNLVPVDHASAHKEQHYDYDFQETWQENIEVFREQWGKRLRILNLASSNETAPEHNN